ncbi:peptidyl-prolyl cis-trans isomerase [Solirubrobacter pauli]|uniref:peptidyl-prolyl cis-trans isomerase n=1 Tax=Solirubrobacter pauli TaxID=166793 RepID=UPI0014773978|nr:peptidyl-prolyl cis-trans isomerase [Solirubrobacter pauli]
MTVLAVAGAGLLGDGAPTDPVATVNGKVIERQAFDHWMTIAATSTGNAGATVPDRADDYRRCIATKRKALSPAQRRRISDPTLRARCRRDYAQLRNQVMQLLISFEWIDGEATLRGLIVTDAEVTRSFEKQKRQSFPKDSDFQTFLKTSGQTVADIKGRVRLDLLSNKIREQVTATRVPVTDQVVEQYYDQHRSRFVEPEERSLRIVVTKRRAAAERARAELERGVSWESVARRYSTDFASKDNGGKLAPLAEGAADPVFDQAIFRARRGRLVGPVRLGSEYYVFTVTKVKRERQRPLAEVKKTIRQLIQSEAEQAALDAFVQDFSTRWRALTECAAGYRTSDCRNGPAPAPVVWDDTRR